MSLSLLPVSSPTFSLYPHSSLYHHNPDHTTVRALVFRHCVAGERLKLGFMGKRRDGFFWVSSVCWSTGGRGGALAGNDDDDKEEEGDVSETEELVEELNETSGASSVLPDRWDVLGLGQAMVDFSGMVDDEFLERLGLEKGTRKLVNHEERGRDNGSVRYGGKDVDDDDDDEEVEDHDNDDEYNEDEDGGNPKIYNWKTDDVNLERHPKKRKLKSLVSSYEFAPRVPTLAVATPAPRSSSGGRNSLTDWNEHETFVLLDAWGDRFLQRGRKSLRSEEWQEVAEKVSEVSKIERTDTQCRNRLDTLKKKYKKEKLRMAETGDTSSNWVYFKKMDMLMSSPPQQSGLSCGLDSGEFVFINPGAYLNRANGVDEMRDSPVNSESTGGEEDDSDGLPPKKRKIGRESDDRSSFRWLADSIHKFSDIYEKIENSKRQQMQELEKMRMDFHRDLEMQKRQIMERAKAEIAKIRRGLDDENDVSAENASG